MLEIVEEQEVARQQLAKRKGTGMNMDMGVGASGDGLNIQLVICLSRLRSQMQGLAEEYAKNNMILLIAAACVCDSKHQNSNVNAIMSVKIVIKKKEKNRREPLDAACDISLCIEDNLGIPLVSQHVNLLAAAYQYIGPYIEGSALIHYTLIEKTSHKTRKEKMRLSPSMSMICNPK